MVLLSPLRNFERQYTWIINSHIKKNKEKRHSVYTVLNRRYGKERIHRTNPEWFLSRTTMSERQLGLPLNTLLVTVIRTVHTNLLFHRLEREVHLYSPVLLYKRTLHFVCSFYSLNWNLFPLETPNDTHGFQTLNLCRKEVHCRSRTSLFKNRSFIFSVWIVCHFTETPTLTPRSQKFL